MTMRRTVIYLIEDISEDKTEIYIGKTKNFIVRKSGHYKTFGNQIKITIIDEVNSIHRCEWEPIETMWIQQFRGWGYKLHNKILGGKGKMWNPNMYA